MASERNVVNDLERLEHLLLPGDPPASADLLVAEDRLPYDLAGPPSPARRRSALVSWPSRR